MTGATRYYRHFKGGKYKVLAIGQDSESLKPVVVYQALYGDHKVWVRPKEMFDGVVERDGKIMKRFTEITKKLTKHILQTSIKAVRQMPKADFTRIVMLYSR